jgi:hypothetical protein
MKIQQLASLGPLSEAEGRAFESRRARHFSRFFKLTVAEF